jgi:GT2 family glycosyltransferase
MFLLARSKAFAAVGGFDERFFMYCEDADLSIRLQLAGWRVRQIPDASVVHAAQRASRGSTRHVLWHVSSLSRHWASAAFWRYLARRGTLRRAGARR